MPSTVGTTLRQERVRQGYTHADIARATGVPTLTVIDLEEGRLPAEDARARAYLRVYARHLGLDAEALLRDLSGDDDTNGAPATDGDPHAGAEEPVAAPLGAGAAAYQPARRVRTGLLRKPIVALAGLGLLAAVVTAVAVVALAGGQREPSVTLTAPPATSAEEETPDPEPDSDPEADTEPEIDTELEIDSEPEIDAEPTVDPDLPEPEQPDPEEAVPGRPPQDTPVQVLHAGVDQAVVDDAVAALEALGYPIVQVSIAHRPYERTTAFYVEGWDTEAEALTQREARVVEVAPNPGFAADARLHVVVGLDWPPPPPPPEP